MTWFIISLQMKIAHLEIVCQTDRWIHRIDYPFKTHFMASQAAGWISDWILMVFAKYEWSKRQTFSWTKLGWHMMRNILHSSVARSKVSVCRCTKQTNHSSPSSPLLWSKQRKIMIIIINLIYIAQFDTNSILTALNIVIMYIQMQHVHIWTYMKNHIHTHVHVYT